MFFLMSFIFLFVGWLSNANAYSYASTTATSLIAPLMTKVSVYIMICLMFSIFSVHFVFHALKFHQVVMWMASAAIIFKTGRQSIYAMTNIFEKMPVTAVVFLNWYYHSFQHRIFTAVFYFVKVKIHHK